jgi:hypothetical protein
MAFERCAGGTDPRHRATFSAAAACCCMVASLALFFESFYDVIGERAHLHAVDLLTARVSCIAMLA